MEKNKRIFWLSAISGAIGAGFGSVAGSNMIFVNMAVGVLVSLLAAWGISGIVK
jgi:hypothetical protein